MVYNTIHLISRNIWFPKYSNFSWGLYFPWLDYFVWRPELHGLSVSIMVMSCMLSTTDVALYWIPRFSCVRTSASNVLFTLIGICFELRISAFLKSTNLKKYFLTLTAGFVRVGHILHFFFQVKICRLVHFFFHWVECHVMISYTLISCSNEL